MVTIIEKISIIIDVDLLFKLNNKDVQLMIAGDSYRIDELYEEALNIFKENLNYKLTHIISGEIMTLNAWCNFYNRNPNDQKSIGIFLRIAEPFLV
jgi:hypothetical protein